MLFALILFFVSVFFLARSLLVFIGLLKDPILEVFSRYGPEEYPYIPLLPILVWTGVFLFTLGTWLSVTLNFAATVGLIGGMVLVCALLGYRYYYGFARWHRRLLKYPRWYYELLARTDRYERRRIAFAWLRLPRRLRAAYNSNTQAFLIWTNFVIMSVVWEVEEPQEMAHLPREYI